MIAKLLLRLNQNSTKAGILAVATALSVHGFTITAVPDVLAGFGLCLANA